MQVPAGPPHEVKAETFSLTGTDRALGRTLVCHLGNRCWFAWEQLSEAGNVSLGLKVRTLLRLSGTMCPERFHISVPVPSLAAD